MKRPVLSKDVIKEAPLPLGMNSERRRVELPVGVVDAAGTLHTDADVRGVTAIDEKWIGMSREYIQDPNDALYKYLMLSLTVTRIGPNKNVTLSDISALHQSDIEALEAAVHQVTFGESQEPG